MPRMGLADFLKVEVHIRSHLHLFSFMVHLGTFCYQQVSNPFGYVFLVHLILSTFFFHIGHRGVVKPVEWGAKLNDFSIKFETFVFTNSKSPNILRRSIKISEKVKIDI